jgi:putative hydrolases of HD superfamily
MTGEPEYRDVAAFLHETGHLKRTRRSGWWIAGVKDPESVAEHSYRTAIIGYVLAVLEGANPDRTAAICAFHDVPEVRLGDIPSTGKRYLTPPPAEDVIKEQTAELPATVGQAVRDLIGEHEARQTAEAVCARDADKLECLLQAREYQAQGYRDVQPWIDTMVAAMRTDAGKYLAAAALETSPSAWWYDIVSGYGSETPRKPQP